MASRAPLQTDQKPYSSTDWIRLIRKACLRGSDATLELARLMSQARQSLPYGSWSHLWQSGGLPFSKRKGEMLVVIGQGVEGIDAQNSAQLPAAWNTLYYLTRLGRATVESQIERGRIHPGMSLQEAKALLAELQPETRRKSSRSKLRDRLSRFAAFVRENLETWSPAEQEFARRRLSDLAGEIQSYTKQVARESDDRQSNCRPWTDQPILAAQRLAAPSIPFSNP